MQFLLGQFIQLHLFRLIKILLWPLCIRPEENSELTFSALLSATAVAPAVSAAVATTVAAVNAAAAAAVAAAAATYIYLMPLRPRPSGPSVPLCVYKSTIIHSNTMSNFLVLTPMIQDLPDLLISWEHGELDTTALLLTVYSTHSGYLDPKKILSTIDPPPGVPGVSKIHIFFLQMKVFSFCAKIDPKRHKLKKPIKIEEKMSKKPCFLRYF